jgi:hypothetical protein
MRQKHEVEYQDKKQRKISHYLTPEREAFKEEFLCFGARSKRCIRPCGHAVEVRGERKGRGANSPASQSVRTATVRSNIHFAVRGRFVHPVGLGFVIIEGMEQNDTEDVPCS